MGSDGSSDHAHVESLLAQRVDKPSDAAIGRLLAKEDLFASHRSEELLAEARKLHGTGRRLAFIASRRGKSC